MKRRNFLKSLILFFSSVTLVSFAYPLVRFLSPLKDETNDGKLVLKKRDVAPGTAKNVLYNDKPVVIVHRPGKGFIAFSRVCTHLGCLVSYDNNKLICPCHAASFNLDGNVLAGPAPKPLEQLPVRVEAEKIVIG